MAQDNKNDNSKFSIRSFVKRLDKFGIKTHKKMLNDAFIGADFSDSAVRWMRFGIGFFSDIILSFKSSVHLDNYKGNDRIVNAYKDAINNFHLHTDRKRYIMAGVDLHTIGDF